MSITPLELGLLVGLNAVAFGAMVLDKLRSKTGSRRIPEARLIGLALVSAGIGSWVGLAMFRHKTRKLGFRVGMAFASIVGAAGWGAWVLR